MESPKDIAKILALQDEIVHQQAILSLAQADGWAGFVKVAKARHDAHLIELAKKSNSLDEMRFLQGRIKELTAIIMSPDVARARIDKLSKAIEGLRKSEDKDKMDSEGITNPDPEIESLLADRRLT